MNKIIHADCLEILRRYPDKHFDLLLTDPPYGVGMASRREVGGNGRRFTRKQWDKSVPSAEYFHEMLRVSKNQIIWGGNYFSDKLPASRCWIVWNKKEGLPRNSFADCELAWTSFDRNAYVFNSRRMGFIRDSPEAQLPHPTQKPLDLFTWCVREFSNQGDTILDPFLGSGTTAVAAVQLSRRYTCVERDAEYVAMAKRRVLSC